MTHKYITYNVLIHNAGNVVIRNMYNNKYITFNILT